MVTIPTGLAINVADVTQRTTASGFRAVLASLFKQSAPGVPVVGVIPGPSGTTPLLVTTRTTDMTYDVSAGFAVTSRAGQGAYVVGTVSNVNLPTTGGDATNPRYDRIYIVQPDPELSETGQARIDVAQGTPSANPGLPSIPTGALELARKLVPAGAATTSAGSALSNYAVKTALNLNVGISDVAGLQAALDGKVGTGQPVPWSAIGSVPAALAHLAANGVIDDASLPARLQQVSSLVTGSWDSVQATGFYRGDTLTNSPLLGAGSNLYFVEVIASTPQVWQNAYAATGTYVGRAFRRVFDGTAWSTWSEYTTDASKLVNGTHSLTLSSSGALALDGATLSQSALTNGQFTLNLDSTGRLYSNAASGGAVPVYARTYNQSGAGSIPRAMMNYNSGTRLMVALGTGTIGAWQDRLVRTYMPFELDSGYTTVTVAAVSGHTGWYSGTKTVTFNDARIAGVPDLTTAVHTSQNNGTVFAGVGSIDNNSFTMTLTREQNVNTGVSWMAANQYTGLEG